MGLGVYNKYNKFKILFRKKIKKTDCKVKLFMRKL